MSTRGRSPNFVVASARVHFPGMVVTWVVLAFGAAFIPLGGPTGGTSVGSGAWIVIDPDAPSSLQVRVFEGNIIAYEAPIEPVIHISLTNEVSQSKSRWGHWRSDQRWEVGSVHRILPSGDSEVVMSDEQPLSQNAWSYVVEAFETSGIAHGSRFTKPSLLSSGLVTRQWTEIGWHKQSAGFSVGRFIASLLVLLAVSACGTIVLFSPLLLGRTRRRLRRLHEGRCIHCAYDRRGLAPSAPCPECGGKQPT